MRCVSCGSENPPNGKFCGICGQSLAMGTSVGAGGFPPDEMRYPHLRQTEHWQDVATGKTEKLVCRISGGIGWLLVSFGTFLIAFGWLGTIDYSYYDDPMSSMRMIGYGVIVLAVSAILFSVRDFVKPPR